MHARSVWLSTENKKEKKGKRICLTGYTTLEARHLSPSIFVNITCNTYYTHCRLQLENEIDRPLRLCCAASSPNSWLWINLFIIDSFIITCIAQQLGMCQVRHIFYRSCKRSTILKDPFYVYSSETVFIQAMLDFLDSSGYSYEIWRTKIFNPFLSVKNETPWLIHWLLEFFFFCYFIYIFSPVVVFCCWCYDVRLLHIRVCLERRLDN
jgi:hypothetical protein